MNPEENIEFEVDCLDINKYFKHNVMRNTPVSISIEKYTAIQKLIKSYGFPDQNSLQIFCFIDNYIHVCYGFAWNMKDQVKGIYLRKSQLNKLFSEFANEEDIKTIVFKGKETKNSVSINDPWLILSIYQNLKERNEKIKCEGMPNHRLPDLRNLNLRGSTKQLYDYLLTRDQLRLKPKNQIFFFIGQFFSIIGILYDEKYYSLDDSKYDSYKDYLIQNIKSYLITH